MNAKRMFALVVAFAAACAGLSGAAAQNMVIGVAGPISGPLREAGEAMRAGVRSAIAGHLASQSPSTVKFEIIIADDAGSQKVAVQAAQKLIAAKARFVIGHHASATSLAAAPLYAKAGIVMVSPTATSSKLNASEFWNVIRLSPGEDEAVIFAARDLAKIHGSKFVIAHDGNAQAQALAALAAKFADIARPALVFDPVKLDKLPGPPGAIIFWTGPPAAGARLLKRSREHDATVQLYSHGPLSAPDFAEAVGAQAAGVRSLLPANQWRHAPPELQKAWRAQGVRDQGTALLAHAAAQIVLAAISAADARNAVAQIRSGSMFETLAGVISFDASGAPKGELFRWGEWRLAEDGKLQLFPAPLQ